MNRPDAEELHRILAQAYREQPRYGLIVRTLFETGLRVSELVRVQVSDVDFTERTIRVREGKGGRDRLVLFTGGRAQWHGVLGQGRGAGGRGSGRRAPARLGVCVDVVPFAVSLEGAARSS